MRKFYPAFTAIGLALLISLLSASYLFAQRGPNRESKNLYLGLGLGINDYGLGFGAEYSVNNKASLYGNLGLGGWGYKYGFGASYYIKQAPFGSAFSMGYSAATGLKDFETEITVEPDGDSESVNMNLNKVGTINLIYSYGWKIGRYHKFILSAGYAIPITTDPYTINTVGVELDEVGETVMDIMQPGGLILGIKMAFGL